MCCRIRIPFSSGTCLQDLVSSDLHHLFEFFPIYSGFFIVQCEQPSMFRIYSTVVDHIWSSCSYSVAEQDIFSPQGCHRSMTGQLGRASTFHSLYISPQKFILKHSALNLDLPSYPLALTTFLLLTTSIYDFTWIYALCEHFTLSASLYMYTNDLSSISIHLSNQSCCFYLKEAYNYLPSF